MAMHQEHVTLFSVATASKHVNPALPSVRVIVVSVYFSFIRNEYIL